MTDWQPIETAPKDGSSIIGGYFHTPWSESHLRGQIVKCWYQPEFGAFISGCREMSLAAGYSFENGSSTQLHSPEYAPVSHWMPLPEPPAIAMEARQGRDGETRLDPKDDSAGRRHRTGDSA